jgi:hypothetical protein
VRGGGELGARATRRRGEPDLGQKGVGKLTGKALHDGGGLGRRAHHGWCGQAAGGVTEGVVEVLGARVVLGEVLAGSDRDRRRAVTGRTSVTGCGTSATPHSAVARLSDEAPVDGGVGTRVR